MDKYVSNRSVSDFLVTDATRLSGTFRKNGRMESPVIFWSVITEQDGIKESGKVYFFFFYAKWVTEVIRLEKNVGCEILEGLEEKFCLHDSVDGERGHENRK